ncbi:MAG: phosphoglucosamine mutase [Phycisphaerae bacterium]
MALMVGVSGIRGLVGETLTPQVTMEFAAAYGTMLNGGRVVLGRDSRPSGAMYAAAATAGLAATGCEVTDLGIAMTPTVGHAIRTGKYDGGFVITASHNPSQWNGLKTLDHLGLAPDVARAERIAQIRDKGEQNYVKSGFRAQLRDDLAGERHVDAVLAALEVDIAPIAGLKVVLDSVNGAGCVDTPRLLAELGCELIHINGEPTGEFAHTPEPLAENLTELCDVVRRHKAAVGFAQDPDADRLALVDENGIFIGEEYTLALATKFVLGHRPGPVAANLSTSRRVDDLAAAVGQKVIRTPVGEAHVARAILSNNAPVGGEGNGGLIDPRISPVRDSLSAISMVLQLMAETGKSLSALVAEIPNYVMIKEKAPCERPRIDAAIAAVSAKFAGERTNQSDGIRIDFDSGWVHLRASNTEPIVRVIAEAATEKDARTLIARVRDAANL